ncbi:MAG: hypothetical protein OXT67_01140 [Zetaproteobacteria bacterium]|nr:hypothetical protein [Zetaproteobacteria bacterium]
MYTRLWSIGLLLSVMPLQAGSLEGMIEIKNKRGEKAGDCSQAVVFVENGATPLAAGTPGTHTVLLKERVFDPPILAIVQGSTVDFPNEDTILHNVFSLSKTKKFDLGLYKQGESKSVTFEGAGLVKAFCNIHADMVSHILILENKFFTQVSQQCSFAIPAPPDGKHTVSVWYALGKGSSTEVEVKAGQASGVKLAVVHKRDKQKKHKNKHGKSYKKAY